MSATAPDPAFEALRLAEADPRGAVTFATALAHAAQAKRDFVTQSAAERALGNATLYLDDLDTALQHFRAALRLGIKADCPELATEARLRLAYALNVRGRTQQALSEIGISVRNARGATLAHAEAQRAAIFNQLGRLDEAYAGYRLAVPALRRTGDRLWLQRVLSNRGVLHGYRHEFAAAEADLREAERLCQELDLSLSLGFIQQNLGWIRTVRGDVPEALHYLQLAEQRFRGLRAPLGEVLTDRAQLLLSVNLVSEACHTAEQAVRHLQREQRKITLPEVRFLLSQAAALDGDHAHAMEEGGRAVREFAQQQRAQWSELARLVVLISRLAAGKQSRSAVRQLESAADALIAAGWPGAAVEAQLQAGRLALEYGWIGRAERQLQRAGRLRHRGPVAQRARAWHAEALLRKSRDNRRGTISAIRTALRMLDEHRATLRATDLRALASWRRIELTELGLRMAFEDGRPHLVFAWAEQGRASHLLQRPVLPPDDPVLAADLSELRATATEIIQLRNAGLNRARLIQHQVSLERKIRDHSRIQRGSAAVAGPTGSVPVRALAEELGDTALLEFVQLDRQLHAITVIDGHARLHQLGPVNEVHDLIVRLPFALHRLARHRSTPESRSAATAMLRHAAERLDEILLGRLPAETGDRSLVLIPTGVLQSLPWSVLPSCRGRPITVAPSAALWHAGHRTPEQVGHVAIAAGPGLPGARMEATAVAAIHHTNPLVGASATVEAVTTALSGAGLAHLAAHGWIHPANPLFSSLRLADGPLTIYDLERLKQAPQLVVLAACDTGRAVVLAGDELLGLSATFLSLGSRQIIASVIPVPDAETTPLMIEFHQLLVTGLPAASALATAQRRLSDDSHAAMAAAAGFVCMGSEYALAVAG
jgi:tetratricopeptide (TPR) repeat protein